MIYKTLAGEDIKWRPNSSPRENASKLHMEAIQLIKELMPTALICEECVLPLGLRYKSLYVDIFIPDFNIMIEVDGSQHDSFNIFYHKDKQAFAKQQLNDKIKEDWCEVNNIVLIRLKEKDGPEEWKRKIIAGANREY